MVAHPADAAVILWTGVGSTDSVDWTPLGPSGTLVPDGSLASSFLGLVATVSNLDPGADLLRVDQVPLPVFPSWSGNFAPGTKLLFTFRDVTVPLLPVPSPGPIGIEFDSPVKGAGVKIQSEFFGPFTAFIDAFDGATLLGSFPLAGSSSAAADGSAIFIGVESDTSNIDKIVLSILKDDGADSFAIGPVLLLTPTEEVPPPPAVPAPASLVLIAAGLLGSWVIARRHRNWG